MNLLNTVQWAAVDTNVNSPTFGQVLSVRPMRTIDAQRAGSGSRVRIDDVARRRLGAHAFCSQRRACACIAAAASASAQARRAR